MNSNRAVGSDKGEDHPTKLTKLNNKENISADHDLHGTDNGRLSSLEKDVVAEHDGSPLIDFVLGDIEEMKSQCQKLQNDIKSTEQELTQNINKLAEVIYNIMIITC